MTSEKFCEACGMPFDWPGVTVGNEEFCCAACARGEACTCPRHDHGKTLTEPKKAPGS